MNTNWNDPNFQGFGGRQSPFGKRPPRPKKEHKAIGTPLSRTLIISNSKESSDRNRNSQSQHSA